jgi:hypothetical protein
MASWDHEGIIELFRNDPRLAPELLEGPLGVEVPKFSEVRAESGTMAELKPVEIHADLVITLRDRDQACSASSWKCSGRRTQTSSSLGLRTWRCSAGAYFTGLRSGHHAE